MGKGKSKELVVVLCCHIPPSYFPSLLPDNLSLYNIFKKISRGTHIRVGWLKVYKLKWL